MGDIIRRKLARGAGLEGGPGADQGWRLAFARAARDCVGLHVSVSTLRLARRSLAEVLELPPDRGLIALLDGPSGGLGLIVLSPDLMAALIEVQTIGRLAAQVPALRRPTRTDAAMVSDVIDRALVELEGLLAEEADLEWAGGFRYASFLEDPRPLGLLLEDQPYRVLLADLALGDGGRSGQVLLALPAEGRGMRPASRQGAAAPSAPETATAFSGALAEAALAAACVLDARIGRLTLPLRAVMALETGLVLPLTGAALDRITLTGLDGRPLATARLGQHRGMRALRLSETAEAFGQGAAVLPGPSDVPLPDNAAGFPFAAEPGLLAVG